MEDTVASLLGRLERWLSKNRPNYLRHLPAGANRQQLDELAKRLGVALPNDLRQLLAWHNGQGDDFIGAFEEDWLLMSCEGIAAAQADLEADTAAAWQKTWIPFLDNDAGDFMFLDTSQPGVRVRQFGLGQRDHTVVAHSMTDWLRDMVENVEKGDYVEDPERGRFMRKRG